MTIISKSDFKKPLFFEKNQNILYFTKVSPLKEDFNEDSLAVISYAKNAYVLAVADGAGGHPKGEEASEKILTTIKNKIENSSKNLTSLRSPILDALEEANKSLISEGLGSRSTVSVCECINGIVRVYQVGDSSVVVCGQKGKIKYRSLSHSPVGYGVESGYIEEKDALNHPDLHYISNLVGDSEMKIEIGPEIPLNPNDTIIVASDGLFDNFSTNEVVEIIRKGSLEEISENIMIEIEKKLDPKSEAKFDDLSFIIYKHN